MAISGLVRDIGSLSNHRPISLADIRYWISADKPQGQSHGL